MRSNPDPVDQPERTALIRLRITEKLHNYHVQQRQVLLIFPLPANQHHCSDGANWRLGCVLSNLHSKASGGFVPQTPSQGLSLDSTSFLIPNFGPKGAYPTLGPVWRQHRLVLTQVSRRLNYFMSNCQTIWLILLDYLLTKLCLFSFACAHRIGLLYVSIPAGQSGQSTSSKNIGKYIVLLLHIFLFFTLYYYAKNH